MVAPSDLHSSGEKERRSHWWCCSCGTVSFTFSATWFSSRFKFLFSITPPCKVISLPPLQLYRNSTWEMFFINLKHDLPVIHSTLSLVLSLFISVCLWLFSIHPLSDFFRFTHALNTLGAFWRLCCISVSFDFPLSDCQPGSEEDCWRHRAVLELTSCSTAGPLFCSGPGYTAIISHESFHMGREAAVSHHCFSCLPTKKKRWLC